jgi:hypothetical protein
MKCICGYEHESGLDESGHWQEKLKGDKHFILVNKGYIDEDGDIQQRLLYACPKCYTVKLAEKWEAD